MPGRNDAEGQVVICLVKSSSRRQCLPSVFRKQCLGQRQECYRCYRMRLLQSLGLHILHSGMA